MVRAFDGSKREVMGEIILPICIGPVTYEITFQVMDIWLAYSYFLGRPRIHAVGTALHQRVKFIARTIEDELEQGVSKPLRASIMVMKVLTRRGFQPGKRLGRTLEGITELVAI
ncbi:hypothetical protein CR513_14869, partial [Mucuna pruriens]